MTPLDDGPTITFETSVGECSPTSPTVEIELGPSECNAVIFDRPGYGPNGGPKPWPEDQPKNRHERRKFAKMKRARRIG